MKKLLEKTDPVEEARKSKVLMDIVSKNQTKRWAKLNALDRDYKLPPLHKISAEWEKDKPST